jgi:hypothetical protein
VVANRVVQGQLWGQSPVERFAGREVLVPVGRVHAHAVHPRALATLIGNLFEGAETEILAGVSEQDSPHLEALEACATRSSHAPSGADAWTRSVADSVNAPSLAHAARSIPAEPRIVGLRGIRARPLVAGGRSLRSLKFGLRHPRLRYTTSLASVADGIRCGLV